MLRDTLKDPSGPRRAAAAEAILRSQGLAAKDKIQHLLTDAHPLVRHQIGMTLTEMNDKAGLSILIQSLPDATSERADFALGLLYRAAGDKAPTAPYQGKKNIDVFCAAWNKWYDSHHGTLDLAKQLAQSELGFTLISTGVKANKIYEIGPAKNVHWEFKLPKYAIDVQVVGPNRLLVAEYTDHRVTERDFKGTILWQQAVQFPIAVQRLPNGNTFFATTSRMAIVDRAGKELFTHTPQSPSIRAAQWLRGGQVAYVSSGGRCVLIDAQGRELKAFEMGATVTAVGSNLEVLPNGRILVPLYSQKQVAEFDWDGRKLWWATIQMPISVSRLTNGNTLVTCAVPQRVVELDREGKEVWSLTTDGRPYRARRR
jgi:hypothetical protein